MTGPLRNPLVLALAAALVALALVEATAIPHKHPVFPWHDVPGYAGLIGLVGCLVVVLLSKWLGSLLLQRSDADD